MALSAIGFEGFEKRLELSFHGNGDLRSLPLDQITEVLKMAECTIVSSLCNEHVDSYVLSESSLFVYAKKVIIKTCGTTKLLLSIPPLLKFASFISLSVISVRYTRGSFFFPEAQSHPHGCFNDEISVLDSHFKTSDFITKAFVMTGGIVDDNIQQWHVYSASSVAEKDDLHPNVYTLEMCMTGLDRKKASVFYGINSSTAAMMTENSGIKKIIPGSTVCDFMFDPCGYSMNSIEGNAVSTIHVTPEDGFSYASFEAVGYDLMEMNLTLLLEKVVDCFRPEQFSIAVHCSNVSGDVDGFCNTYVDGYMFGGPNVEMEGGKMMYQRFYAFGGCESPRSTLNYHGSPKAAAEMCPWKEDWSEEDGGGS